jgi:hypothetical protein
LLNPAKEYTKQNKKDIPGCDCFLCS